MTGFSKIIFGDNLTVTNLGGNVIRVDAVAAAAPAFVRLADSTLTSDAANFDFTSISGSYAHLRIVVYARTNNGSSGDTIGVRFNNDSGSNYGQERAQAAGSGVSAVLSASQTFGLAFFVPANSATAGEFGIGEILIPHYAQSTNLKFASAVGGDVRGVGVGGEQTSSVIQWNSAAAINRVTLLPAGGGSLIKAGSRATVYGML